jgi:phosphoribosyl-ATP pyrophosphohydrolase
MIETRHKDKAPRHEPYVMNASEVSDLLLDTPQYQEMLLCFTYLNSQKYRDSLKGKSKMPISILSVAFRRNPEYNPYNLDTQWYACVSTLPKERKNRIKNKILENASKITRACKHLEKNANLGDGLVDILYYPQTGALSIVLKQNGSSLEF